MPKKKQEAAPVAPAKAASKKSAKSAKAAPKAAKKPAKKAEAKPVSAKQAKKVASKRTRIVAIDPAVVLAAFEGGKVLSKGELVSACGGDEAAVTKVLKKLRGEGKIAAMGSTRNSTYRAA